MLYKQLGINNNTSFRFLSKLCRNLLLNSDAANSRINHGISDNSSDSICHIVFLKFTYLDVVISLLIIYVVMFIFVIDNKYMNIYCYNLSYKIYA